MKIYMHELIYSEIVSAIEKGELVPGDLLPSEKEMIEKYKASKSPIRQALSRLENEGYIYKMRGKGSIVSKRNTLEDWINMSGFKENYNLDWNNISALTTELKIITDKEYSQLFSSSSENVIYLERIRYLGKQPIFFMKHYLSIEIPFDLFQIDRTFSSIQQLLFDKVNITLTTAQDELEAIVTDDYIAKKLNLPIGSPLLKGTRISTDSEGKIYNVDIFYTPTHTWKYKAKFEYNSQP